MEAHGAYSGGAGTYLTGLAEECQIFSSDVSLGNAFEAVWAVIGGAG